MSETRSRRRSTRVALVAGLSGLAVVASSVVAMNTAYAATVRHEAEAAPAVCGGLVEANHAGHSGTGFCNSDNAVGAAVEFRVNAAAAGPATLTFGYANGGTDSRAGEVLVNGAVVGTSQFGVTGAWTSWGSQTVTAQLNAGANTVRLRATGAGGLANVDYLDVTTGGSEEPGGGDGVYEVEALTRGVTVVPSGSGNLVSWRLLGTDPQNVAFNVYRDGTRITSSPITGATNYLDSSGSGTYTVAAVNGGTEGTRSGTEVRFGSGGYFDIPISRPSSIYDANDASVADLDGDGDYEYIVKWSRTTPRTTRRRASPTTPSSTPTPSRGPASGGSTWGATSGPGPTTPSSRCTTTTVTATPRSP